MSDAPTADQLSDLRGDIGDVSGTVFTDVEITRFWSRVSSARTPQLQYDATMALMCRALMMNAAKLRDYTTGTLSDKQGQIFDHLKAMFNEYKSALEAVLGDNANNIAVGHLSGVQDLEQPIDNGSIGGTWGLWVGDPNAQPK